jgi:hypothetical protein
MESDRRPGHATGDMHRHSGHRELSAALLAGDESRSRRHLQAALAVFERHACYLCPYIQVPVRWMALGFNATFLMVTW